jgi:two-component system cell cycle response regulator DivK
VKRNSCLKKPAVSWLCRLRPSPKANMPDTTVLVVDDSAVNLKLADILLRKEGFTVHAVASAEEALRVLRTVKPSLLLVDIQLPGMDGLELARRTKEDPRTQDVVILALTASNTRSDRDRASAAGCAGYITKPIDTRTFAAQIADYLLLCDRPSGLSPADAPGAGTADQVCQSPVALSGEFGFTSIEIESLRRRFLEEGLLQCRQMLTDLGARWDTGKARQLLHRWIGSAGALGYSEIAASSRDAETELSLPSPKPERIRELLSDLALAFTHPREAAIGPLPEFITKELAGQRIGLVDFAAEEAERLCTILDSFGARPLLFAQFDRPLSEAVRICHVVLVHARAAVSPEAWLPAGSGGPEAPIVLVGERDSILALDPFIQGRASEFLIDGWQPEEALMRLKYALSRANRGQARAAPSAVAEPSSPRVLIADDDEIVVSQLQAALEAQGMQCWTAYTGLEAQDLISIFDFQAAVIDVNMPGKNGFDLLAGIRVAGSPMRVLLLTACGGESNVVKGFNLGADDYVVKPCSPAEVAVRLKRLSCGAGW